MTDVSFNQAVLHKMNELMRASSDCAEFDPAMSAKLAAAAKDLGRDLGITAVTMDEPRATEPARDDDMEVGEEDEFQELMRLLHLQKKAVAAVNWETPPKPRLAGWLGLDVWSRW